MLMDFIFGKPAESNLNQRSQDLNNLLLDELMRMYQQGPNPLPTYTAVAPDIAYSAPNTLLASLGMESVARPDLPTTEIAGRTVYSSEALQKAIEEKFAEENPELYARLMNQMAARMNPVSSGSSYVSSSDGGPDYDPIALHYELHPMTNPANFQNSLTTGGPSAASQSVFQAADLYGNHGGNHFSKIADDVSTGVSNFVSGGGIIGAIANAFSGNKDDDDPVIGNVP